MLLRLCHVRSPHLVVSRIPIILPLVRPISISKPSVQATSSPSSQARASIEKVGKASPDQPRTKESKSSSVDSSSSASPSNQPNGTKISQKDNSVQRRDNNTPQEAIDAASTSTSTPTSTTNVVTSTLPPSSPSTTEKDLIGALTLETISQTIETIESIVKMPSTSSNEKNAALRESLKVLQEHRRLVKRVANLEKSTSSSSLAPKRPASVRSSSAHAPKANTFGLISQTSSKDWAFLQGAFLRKPAGQNTPGQGHENDSRAEPLIKLLPIPKKIDRWPKKKLETIIKSNSRALKLVWTRAKKRSATVASPMDLEKLPVKPKKVNPRKVFGWEALWEESWDGEKAVHDVTLLPPHSNQEPVPGLEHEFDKALFKPGVHFYQDPKTNAYNFDKRAQAISHPDEFDLSRLSKYVTASKDQSLAKLASDNECTFFGSTSSLTPSLSQVFFALSNNRPVDTSSLSYHFFGMPITTSYSATVPCSIFLRYNEKTGTYGIDGDKTMEHVGQPTHLMDLGHVMEKMLTTTVEDVKRYRKDAPEDAISLEERNRRETYHYSKGPDIVMRSQLDGYDARLPGTGIFDIKTRATASIRHDIENIEGGKHYEITSDVGLFESFERERYDMMRSAFLKYNFQGRIGGMEGMFVAYHNTANIQGIEYFPLTQLDKYLFGSTRMGDQAYSMCVKAFSKLLKIATEQFPKQTLHLTLSAKDLQEPNSMMTVVKPVDPSGKVSDTKIAGLRLSFYSTVDSEPIESGIDLGPEGILPWKVLTKVERSSPEHEANLILMAKMMRKNQEELGSQVILPPHMTKQEMQDLFAARWERVKAAEEGRPIVEATSVPAEVEKNRLDDEPSKEGLPETKISTSTPSKSEPTPTSTHKAGPPRTEERPPRVRFRPPSQLVTILRTLSERARLRALSLSESSVSDSTTSNEQSPSSLSAKQEASRMSKAARRHQRKRLKKRARSQVEVQTDTEAEVATGAEIEEKVKTEAVESIST